MESNHAPSLPTVAQPKAGLRVLAQSLGNHSDTLTLAKLVVTGGGPRMHKAGRTPLYAASDLDRWACELLGEPLDGQGARP